MIYEQHNFFQVPPTCQPPANATKLGSMVELASLWVNDTELASYLKQTYPGLPVYYSPIQTETKDFGPGGVVHTWSWGLGAQNQSQMNIVEDQQGANPLEDYFRIFWYDETGVSVMDLDNAYSFPLVTARLAYGTLYPPMLWGNIAVDYASTGNWAEEVTMQGHITIFRDHECKQPV
jgi:hypothetical protein